MKNHLSLKVIPLRVVGLLIFFYFVFSTTCLARQKSDTVTHKTLKERVASNKTFKGLLKGISRKPQTKQLALNEKSEAPFLKYEGKIVRSISVKHLGFETTVLDTARNLKNFITRTANNLHTNTREFVVRNYLFVKEGNPLNPYRLADNERTLRNLDFIMDARIYVLAIRQNPDSVDLVVVTRDVFSLGASFSAIIPTKYYLSVRDINLAGAAQRVQFGQLLNGSRTPHYGFDAAYQLNNIKGTFIDALVGYTTVDNGIGLGYENEQSLYFKLSRALYQPFAKVAGGIEFSDNISKNVYSNPDSAFSKYRYQIQDYWIGYSFGNKHLPNDLRENRNRKFVAVRMYDQYFLNASNQELYRFVYRNRTSLLGQLTFFRQDFYKTQYVVGFGRTEDVPYGYRLSFTAGWEKELGNRRPYSGAEFDFNHVRPTGSILSYSAKIASYWNKHNPEDGLVSLGFSRYSRAISLRKMILRHRFESSFAVVLNREVKPGININDANGIMGFKPDSLVGTQRLNLSQEELVFTPWKVLGFRVALVARIDLSLIQRNGELFESRNFFSGFSLGLRTRNENLIFNTVEMRLFYYPKTVELIEPYRFNVTGNFRIRYPTNLVNKPATVFNN